MVKQEITNKKPRSKKLTEHTRISNKKKLEVNRLRPSQNKNLSLT